MILCQACRQLHLGNMESSAYRGSGNKVLVRSVSFCGSAKTFLVRVDVFVRKVLTVRFRQDPQNIPFGNTFPVREMIAIRKLSFWLSPVSFLTILVVLLVSGSRCFVARRVPRSFRAGLAKNNSNL